MKTKTEQGVEELEKGLKIMLTNKKEIEKRIEDYSNNKRLDEDFMDNYRRFEQIQATDLEVIKFKIQIGVEIKTRLEAINEMLELSEMIYGEQGRAYFNKIDELGEEKKRLEILQ